MGQISTKRIWILLFFILITGLVIIQKHSQEIEGKDKKLENTLRQINGWTYRGNIPLDFNIIDSLNLDDYLNTRYSDGQDQLSLYIGYYFSAKKIGAAHDPMVCFPGQGWKISDKKTGDFNLESGNTIKYSMMTGQLGSQKELITYWFQSYDQTNSSTFSQKITLLWKKIMNKGEDNAFVRITISMGTRPVSEYKEKTFEFIQAFYPVFHEFIISE